MKNKCRGGRLINFLPLKGGGLLQGGGIFEAGGLNGGFMVLHFQNDYSSMPFWPVLVISLCLGLVVDSDISNFQYLV